MEPSPHSSGVSWGAVFGGATVTAALSLILLALGAGLGLSAVSPWSGSGASAAAIGGAAILWLIAMQIMRGAMGGYLAGRLRSRWPSVHGDEVYFRDTAHGFLAWGLALVVTAAFLATAATAMVGDVAGSHGGEMTMASSGQNAPDMYFTDMLFRSSQATADPNDATTRSEAARIVARAMMQRELVPADRARLGELIVQHTGVSLPAADQRVTDVMTTAQQATDSARKAVAHSLLWIFLALLIGAFSASVAATIGGRQRDLVVLV
jgi:hypothetical protein